MTAEPDLAKELNDRLRWSHVILRDENFQAKVAVDFETMIMTFDDSKHSGHPTYVQNEWLLRWVPFPGSSKRRWQYKDRLFRFTEEREQEQVMEPEAYYRYRISEFEKLRPRNSPSVNDKIDHYISDYETAIARQNVWKDIGPYDLRAMLELRFKKLHLFFKRHPKLIRPLAVHPD